MCADMNDGEDERNEIVVSLVTVKDQEFGHRSCLMTVQIRRPKAEIVMDAKAFRRLVAGKIINEF